MANTNDKKKTPTKQTGQANKDKAMKSAQNNDPEVKHDQGHGARLPDRGNKP